MDKTIQGSLHKPTILDKPLNSNDVVHYLDSHWDMKQERSLTSIKKLDAALGLPSKNLKTIFVAGANGKSLTVHFMTRLLHADHIKVGSFYAPHILSYNERLSVNNETISTKTFTEIGQTVIQCAEQLGLKPHTSELLTMMALLYFQQNKVDVAIFEIDKGGAYNPANVCNPLISVITRVTPANVESTPEDLQTIATDIAGVIKKDTHVICGDQTKSTLALLQDLTKAQNGVWCMPIRKLAALSYPFEQLHGRPAALAERAAQLFVEQTMNHDTEFVANSFLSKQHGSRGRPTIEAKKQLETNPRKTVEHFWKEAVNELPGRFQMLDKEKPTVLLDNARNVDAFENLLLGVRLVHYKKQFKGLAIIIGAADKTLHSESFLKALRYFLKKTYGQIFIVPIEQSLPGLGEEQSWNVEAVTNDIKGMKIKVRACTSFKDAFEQAKRAVDERNGMIVVTGSQSIINTYWQYKGVKKL
jgi:dihydrofolate synthase/folylpolyglutamate synthase